MLVSSYKVYIVNNLTILSSTNILFLCSLRNSIQIYTEDNDIMLPQGFIDCFPETPKISQTIAVWTLLTSYESESKK